MIVLAGTRGGSSLEQRVVLVWKDEVLKIRIHADFKLGSFALQNFN